jgi:predicted DNA-binding ribbon-helix-helix protein
MAVKKTAISMDAALYARLKSIADEEGRTFSNLLAHFASKCADYYEKHGKKRSAFPQTKQR